MLLKALVQLARQPLQRRPSQGLAVSKATAGLTPEPYVQAQMVSLEFYSTLKEELTPILYKLFQKTEAKEPFPSLLYEASVTLLPKPDKNSMKGKMKGKERRLDG